MKARTDENTYSPHSGLTPALSVMEAAQLNKLLIHPQQENIVRVQHIYQIAEKISIMSVVITL
jgi:hypothetical protein